MHFIVSVIILFSSTVSSASSRFWGDVLEKNFSKLNNTSVIITGVITHIKRKYNARDTWYLVDIKDQNSDRFVSITLYTTKKLRSVNLFDCKEGDKFRISGKFVHKSSGDQVGTVLINSKDNKLKCYKNSNKDSSDE